MEEASSISGRLTADDDDDDILLYHFNILLLSWSLTVEDHDLQVHLQMISTPKHPPPTPLPSTLFVTFKYSYVNIIFEWILKISKTLIFVKQF